MALYFYRGLSKEGKKTTGYIDASSIANAKEKLTQQQIYPTDLSEAHKTDQKGFFKSLFARNLSLKDKILFTNQLATLLKAGVPLLQALELLIDQFKGSTKNMIVAIKDEVKQGTSLAQALQQFPRSFDQIYVQLVRAGEASGKLETILVRLTDFLERKEELRKRLTSALIYPAVQLGFSVVIVAALLYFVVPSLVENIKGMSDKPLPLPTRILMGISTAFTAYWWLIALVLLSVVGLFLYWKSTPRGRYLLDVAKLRIPVVGYFVRMNAVVQFSSTLGLLLESGVNLAESLDIVVSIIDNQVLARTLSEARDKIIRQGKISQYLKQTTLFPPIAIYLINTGEQSGQLDAMLLTVAQTYENDLKEWSNTLSSLLSPLLLVVMAGIVGFIIMAVLSPMFSVMSSMNE